MSEILNFDLINIKYNNTYKMKQILVLFLLSTLAFSLYEGDSAVFKLTEANFKKSVLESD